MGKGFKSLIIGLISVCASALLMQGCSRSVGNMPQGTGTEVSLKGSNYKIITAGARGESEGFALFGILPIISPNYADAKASLYTSSGQRLEGRAIALTNQTYDRSTVYLILFSLPKITITADIVEFDAAP